MTCVDRMYAPPGRLVIVPAETLDDLLELSRLAAAQLPLTEPLRHALIGSIAAIRTSITMEP